MSSDSSQFAADEEEEWGSGGSSDELVFRDEELVLQEELIEEREKHQEAVKQQNKDKLNNELIERFAPSSAAAMRLINDLKLMMNIDAKDVGFSCSPIDNDIFTWEVHLFGFDEGTPIFEDMRKYNNNTGRSYIEMRVSFPPDYPMNPPFVRVVQPRFKKWTGHVSEGGSLCMDILTKESWNPMYSIHSVILNILSEFLSAKPRIDFSCTAPYSLQEAKITFMEIATWHNWKVQNWLPSK